MVPLSAVFEAISARELPVEIAKETPIIKAVDSNVKEVRTIRVLYTQCECTNCRQKVQRERVGKVPLSMEYGRSLPGVAALKYSKLLDVVTAKLPKVAWHDKPRLGIDAMQSWALNTGPECIVYKRSGADVPEVKAIDPH